MTTSFMINIIDKISKNLTIIGFLIIGFIGFIKCFDDLYLHKGLSLLHLTLCGIGLLFLIVISVLFSLFKLGINVEKSFETTEKYYGLVMFFSLILACFSLDGIVYIILLKI